MNESESPERHDPVPPPVVEGTYEPPEAHPASGRNWRAAGGTAVGIAVLAAKFKTLLFALLNLKWIFFLGKFAVTGFSFLVSIWFYTLFFGLKFAIVFVLLIAIHELGHAIFVRGYGLSAPAIVFLPGFGAFTSWTGGSTTVYQESMIAFGGPLLGTIGGLVCFAYGALTNEPFWLACAYTAFFLNLFNMIPLGIFDGGRMTAAISPQFWIAGFAIVIVAAIAFHWWSPILLIVVLLSVPQAIAAFRGRLDPRYAQVAPSQKVAVAVAYFSLLAILLACVVFSHVAVPGHAIA